MYYVRRIICANFDIIIICMYYVPVWYLLYFTFPPRGWQLTTINHIPPFIENKLLLNCIYFCFGFFSLRSFVSFIYSSKYDTGGTFQYLYLVLPLITKTSLWNNNLFTNEHVYVKCFMKTLFSYLMIQWNVYWMCFSFVIIIYHDTYIIYVCIKI